MLKNFMKQQEAFQEISQIRKQLKKTLDPMRYEHSISVSFTCACLAMRYGCDLHRAELAGLLHDCAKHYSDTELRTRCEAAGIVLTEEELLAPQVIHARYGAYLARKAFGIKDEEILSAIASHTLGKPDMSLLEAIVFVADYIEARRFKADKLPEVRKLAFTDLNRCIYEITQQTISFLNSRGAHVCRDSLETYAYYQRYGKINQKT